LKPVARLLLLLPALGLLALAPSAARAQLSLTFTQASLSGTPGSTLTFSATLLNKGVTETFLNGDTFTLTGTGLTLDDTKFFANAPLSLLGGASFTGPIFDVVLAPAAVPNNYAGTFSVLGGANSTATQTLATGNFQVNVVRPQQAAIPEPGVGTLLAAGVLPALGIVVRGRRKPRGAVRA